MSATSSSKKPLAIVLAENIYENLELHYPRLRLIEAGFEVLVAGPKKGEVYQSKEGYPVRADVDFSEVDPKQIKVLIVPGGYAPDKLRRYKACNELVAAAWNAGAVVAFVCHAGWVPISAKIVKGRRLTSLPAIKDDLINAGAEWIDEPCVVDGKMVSAQVPKDLPAMMSAVLKLTA
ncbi:MAG TPA: type 1 glutamine amidotransferase domain-containing protein [Planctomycetota bacterium]|nr:type 1 glutamine amidotransferase domain-containing protein [Planctomycetota bacterium]